MFQTIEGIVPLLHFERQTKRNHILGFVDDLGSTLFGVATTSQLGVLRRHINIMTNTLNNITHLFSQSENDLSSCIQHVNEELENFDVFMVSDKKIIDEILKEEEKNDHLHKVTESIILRFTEKFAKARANINSLLKGIHILNSGKLSSFIIPAERLQRY